MARTISDDVRLVGGTLGEVLFEDVEAMRRAALRAREAEGDDAREELARRGVGRAELLAALGELEVRYVFTAHPTEARRRTTERLLAVARRALERRERELCTGAEEKDCARELRAAVEALWLHAEERGRAPEVKDEVKAGLRYLEHVLLDVVPRAERRLHEAIEAHYGAIDADALRGPWRFGSWMGADRDGNPFVDEAVTERTLALQRELVLRRYARDLDGLADALVATEQRLPACAELERALERAAAAVPELRADAERRNPREPLRRDRLIDEPREGVDAAVPSLNGRAGPLRSRSPRGLRDGACPRVRRGFPPALACS